MDHNLEVQPLEDQLKRAITRRAELIGEINDHISLIAKKPLQSGLFIPDDILIIIFRCLLLSNPGAIGHLLFVCRQWYSVIMSTPVLWSSIELTPSNNLKSLSSWTAYCRECIQRSGSRPLQISINYREVIEPQYIAVAAIYPVWKTVGLEGRTHSFFKSFCHAVPRYRTAHFARFEAPIRVLVGPHGSEVSRWQALTLDGGVWVYRILSLIRGNLGGEPLPKRMFSWAGRIICRIPTTASHDPKEMGPDYRTISPLFPNPSPLRYLSIPLVLPLNWVDPYSVQEIEVLYHLVTDLRYVLQFRHLKYLVIRATHQSYSGVDRFKAGDIYFPMLIEFEVQSRLSTTFWEHLDAPRLETLRIDKCQEFPLKFGTLPTVRRIEVWFENLDKLWRIQDLILACPSLQTFVCRGRYMEYAAVMVQRLIGNMDIALKLSGEVDY
ncbi:hypothetical protein FRC14_004179 [Serendipita sp. 396]|nr:hypothetical protein FRC14_004179 [Serendipita sp. 396]